MKRALFATVTATLLACACVYVARYEYLSFEGVPGVVVEEVASADAENLLFGPEMIVEYSLQRDDYKLKILIDPQNFVPNVTIEIVESQRFRLVPKPWRGLREGRVGPCASFDHIAPSGDSFLFTWKICDQADDSEMVVPFDVVGESIGVREENLPFTIRTEGVWWQPDGL